ncbi:MAG: tRNA (adenosine(37)-N6)-threonylcarbamoyltransferase complex ATPase subunit type 1 TsaE [Bacteroidota bacterium]
MLQKTLISHHLNDLPDLAAQILGSCNRVRIFAFSGDLGAGKTTLVQHLCRKLGVKDKVTSPTFSLVNEYASPAGPVYHFDFYRIEDEEEAYDIGADEYFDSGYYCLIEWPERIPTLLPGESARLALSMGIDGTRQISLTC